MAEYCEYENSRRPTYGAETHRPGKRLLASQGPFYAEFVRNFKWVTYPYYHWRTQRGGLGGSTPAPEILKKLGQIPSSVEYTSVTT
jgi:hypothetical protein